MSNLYQHYYTSADVNVYLTSLDYTRKLQLDLAVGIGYNHQISAMPVYGLGFNEPEFYSVGNSIVTGRLEITYKSNKYITLALEYLYGDGAYKIKLEEIEKKLNADRKSVTDEELQFYEQFKKIRQTERGRDESLASYTDLVNLVLIFDNTNSFKTDRPTVTTITGVRFMGFSQGISSSAENTITDQYSFYGKNITNTNTFSFETN